MLFLGITVAFFGLAGRAFWLQVVSNDFLQDEGEKRYARTLTIAGERGEILDRNGVVLAASQPVRSIWADPQLSQGVSKEDIRKLADVLGLDPDAAFEEAKQAWRRLAKANHPDVAPGDAKAAERFQAVQAAYEVLRRAEERRQAAPGAR